MYSLCFASWAAPGAIRRVNRRALSATTSLPSPSFNVNCHTATVHHVTYSFAQRTELVRARVMELLRPARTPPVSHRRRAVPAPSPVNPCFVVYPRNADLIPSFTSALATNVARQSRKSPFRDIEIMECSSFLDHYHICVHYLSTTRGDVFRMDGGNHKLGCFNVKLELRSRLQCMGGQTQFVVEVNGTLHIQRETRRGSGP
ncbi:hypothetical protein CBL_01674 [Carabus blaptoides fortunei]